MGGEGRGCRCHDSDVRRRGANPAPSPRARAHTDMHTRAHRRSPSDTLEGKVKLKARERGGRRSRHCRAPWRTRPRRLSLRRRRPAVALVAPLAPAPRSVLPRSPTPGARASTRPLPPALQARVRPGARAGRERARAPQGGGCGGRSGGLPARPPTPSARARQVSAVGGERMSEDEAPGELSPLPYPFRGR